MAHENKTRYALLGMLNLGSMSGYDLKKLIEDSTGNFWHESYGQIYPMLKQLAREDLTIGHVEKQEGRPERYIYTLSDKGREELQRWLTEPIEYQMERNELLLKLFFGEHAHISSSVEHVQNFRTLQLQLLQKYDTIEASLKDSFAEHRELPYWLITLSYGKHRSQALLAWCDETLVTLHKLVEAKPLPSD